MSGFKSSKMRESNSYNLIPKSKPIFSLSWLKYLILFSSSGILLLSILMIAGMWQTGSHFFTKIGDFFTISTSKPEVDIPTLVVAQIRQASELTTAVFVMEAVVPTSQDRKLGDFTIGTTKLLYIAHGEVKAGVNLDLLKSENISFSGKKMIIQLPPPEILDSKIDVNQSSVYDYNRGFLGLGPDVAPELQTLAQRQTLEKIVTTACNKGILNTANDKAQLAIAQLLNLAGYEEVEVKITPPSPTACEIKTETKAISGNIAN